MSRRHSLRIFAVALLIWVLASLLAACGGGGGNEATATKPATKVATAQMTKASATAPPTAPTGTEEAEASATALATELPAPTSTPPSGAQTTLDVVMRDFAIELSIDTASAGTVTFNIENQGMLVHDFFVIRTELAPDALPVDSAAFQVKVSELDVVKYQPQIAAGYGVQVMVDLSAGHYVLICNIASHYQAGSRTAFTVQ